MLPPYSATRSGMPASSLVEVRDRAVAADLELEPLVGGSGRVTSHPCSCDVAARPERGLDHP